MTARMEIDNGLKSDPGKLGDQDAQPTLEGLGPQDSPIPQYPRGETTLFKGRTRLYLIRMYRSGSDRGFVRKIDEKHFEIYPEHLPLIERHDANYREVYPERAKRKPVETRNRILQGLSYPRTFQYEIYEQSTQVGDGTFTRMDAGPESFITSSRAIKEEHVHEGIGTHILELAIRRHKREAARWGRPLNEGWLMTQRWESIKSLSKLKEKGVIDKIQPIDEQFDEKGKRLLYIAHAQMRMHSTGIDLTGRSTGELIELGWNENLDIPEEGTEAREINDKIVLRPPAGAGVSFVNGDVLYVRWTIPDQLPPAGEDLVTSGK